VINGALMVIRHLQGEEARHVLIVGLLYVCRMNKRIQIAKLEFDAGFHAVLFNNFRELVDDLKAVINGALMVIRHLQGKKVGKVELAA
jgi:hypothetical protein